MRRLPLFVLPTVLFPGAQAPLHVFERRYRQMVARCLEFDMKFGFLFHRSDVYGPFRVTAGRVGCVARITEFRPLPDGRSLMLAEGLQRFQIEDGIESESHYHEAVVSEYSDEEELESELIERRRESIELLHDVVDGLSDAPRIELDSRREMSFELAAALQIDAVWQQGILEVQREAERLDRINEVLRAVLRARGRNRPSSS